MMAAATEAVEASRPATATTTTSFGFRYLWPQIFATIAATLGAFSLGTINGWTSPGLPDLNDRGDLGGGLSDDQQSWIASLASLACLVAVYPSGWLIQKYGRKPVMIALALPFVLGWLLMAFASHVSMLYVGRTLTGLCSGTFSIAAPVYIGEIAESRIRGALGSTFQLMVVAGILFAYVVGTYVSWKTLSIICALPNVLCLLCLLGVPESPRYLLSVGKKAEATAALMWLRGASTEKEVEEERDLIHHHVLEHAHHQSESSTSFGDLLAPEILKPTAIGISMMLFQQLTGIDGVTFYTVQIFRESGSDLDPNTSTIIFGSVQVLFNFVALALVDRLGRRPLLLGTNVVIVLSLTALGTFFWLQNAGNDVVDEIGWLPLVSLMTYAAAFSIGIGPIGWGMIGEILPNHVIGIASPLATSVLWALSFLITRFFSDLSDWIGNAGVFWFFAGCTILASLVVYFWVPETKGRTLDQIQEGFMKK